MALFRRRKTNEPAKLPRRDAWRIAAERIGGVLEEGGRPSQDRIVLERGPWRTVADTYTVYTGQVMITYTRTQSFFLSRSPIQLSVRKRTFIDSFLERIGLGRPILVNRMFDRRWVARGKPASRSRSIFSPELVETIMAQPSVSLTVRRASRKQRKLLGDDACQVTAQVTGVLVDPNHLVGLFDVVRTTLASLERIGMATPAPDAGTTP